MIDSIYKEVAPEVTIERIRNFFLEHQVLVTEKLWENPEDGIFSCQIQIENTHFMTWGKGTSREFSLASAYGELMEELLTGLSFVNTFIPNELKEVGDYYIDKHVNTRNFVLSYLPKSFKNSHPFENDLTLYDFIKQNPLLFSENDKEQIVLVPFKNYLDTEKSVEFLPIALINLCCGSNGICAGNSKEEALDHGFSEIMERYVTKKLYFENYVPPTVLKNQLKSIFPEEYDMIDAIEKRHQYKIIVKDCTFNNKYPVMGIILLDIKSNTYCVNLGADPDIRIALRRCITEIYQGGEQGVNQKMNNIDFSIDFKPEDWMSEYNSQIKNSSGKWKSDIFVQIPTAQCKLQVRNFLNFDQKMKYWNLKFRELDIQHVYVRDCSIEIINAFQIFIPGVSEVFKLPEYYQKHYTIDKQTYCCQINNLDETALRKLAEDIENYLVYVFHNKRHFIQDYLGLQFDHPFWDAHPLEYLNFIIYLTLKDRPKASKWGGKYLELLSNTNQKDNGETILLKCITDILKLPESNANNGIKILSLFYDSDLLNLAYKVIETPNVLIEKIPPIPCFQCDNCSTYSSCEYEKIINIIKITCDELKKHSNLNHNLQK